MLGTREPLTRVILGSGRYDFMSQRLLNTPAVAIYPRPNCSRTNPRNIRPIGYSLGVSIKNQNPISVLISRLFFSGSPLAVFRLVVSAVVDSINGVLWRWPWSHVGKKFSKFQPPFTDLNAPCFVPSERPSLCASAPAQHTRPNFILGGAGLSVSGMMGNLPAETSTAFGFAVHEAHRTNGAEISAIANTIPHYPPILAFFGSERGHQEPSESHTRKVFEVVVHNFMDNEPSYGQVNP